MRLTVAITTLLIRTAITSPNAVAQSDKPEKPLQCPEGWYFDFASFHGPGCPDSNPKWNRTGYSITSQGWGSHFVAGQCDTQWAWFDFPYLQASIGPGVNESKSHTWCEAKIKYSEATEYSMISKKDSKWILRMHKNGTSMEAEYGLDKGVNVEWKITYSPPEGLQEPNRIDIISINGPVWNETRAANRLDWSTTSDPIRHIMPECGPNVFGMRVELSISSKDPKANGTVISKRMWDVWSGAVLGMSFDWKPCTQL